MPIVLETPKPSWYEKSVTSINPDAQRLLETYSGFKPKEVIPHVLALRDEAFAIHHYACIGQMRFLAFNLLHSPYYSRVISRLRASGEANLLDVGCCFGQELRYLASQGIDSSRLFGCDIEPLFIDLAYQLFRDKDKLKATFILDNLAADTPSPRPIDALHGRLDVIFASSFLHLFDREDQVRVTCRLVQCFDPKREGVLFVGRQMGSTEAGSFSMGGVKEGSHYRHDLDSIQKFWKEVGKRTNTRWSVEAELDLAPEIKQNKNATWADEKLRMIYFCATRLA